MGETEQITSLSIIPAPLTAQVSDGHFVLDSSCCINSLGADGRVVDICAQQVRTVTGWPFPACDDVALGNSACRQIQFVSDTSLSGSLGAEGYRLVVTADAVTIRSSGACGLFYGFQSFRQLLPAQAFDACCVSPEKPIESLAWKVPCCEITDKPRFSWRGVHLDVGRFFMPKEFVKKLIDVAAQHKMNRFHWHLTEDQGWRIEIKRYPKLTEVGAWRSETLVGHAARPKEKWVYDGVPHGGFYTQDDVREIVAYAAERYVEVVPEIEMPGHSQAAIAAYPELGNVSESLGVHTSWGVNENVFNVRDSTLEFLKNVLEEVMELFPSTFIHIGGDECPKTQWQKSSEAQDRIKELGLADEKELQSWFIRQIDAFLASRGRRLVGWDEILEGGLAEHATVMSWQGIEGGIQAAKMGHDVIMVPMNHTYLDFYQTQDILDVPLAIGGYLPLDKIYSYDPVPPELTAEQGAHVLGTQCQLWTEYMQNPGQVERMAFPRLCALAEVAWSNIENKCFADFEARLTSRHLERLKVQHIDFWDPNANVSSTDLSFEEATHFFAVHVDDGKVIGKACKNLESACALFDNLHPHFATMVMDHVGNELRYYGGREHRPDEFRAWLKQKQGR